MQEGTKRAIRINQGFFREDPIATLMETRKGTENAFVILRILAFAADNGCRFPSDRERRVEITAWIGKKIGVSRKKVSEAFYIMLGCGWLSVLPGGAVEVGKASEIIIERAGEDR